MILRCPDCMLHTRVNMHPAARTGSTSLRRSREFLYDIGQGGQHEGSESPNSQTHCPGYCYECAFSRRVAQYRPDYR